MVLAQLREGIDVQKTVTAQVDLFNEHDVFSVERFRTRIKHDSTILRALEQSGGGHFHHFYDVK